MPSTTTIIIYAIITAVIAAVLTAFACRSGKYDRIIQKNQLGDRKVLKDGKPYLKKIKWPTAYKEQQ